MLQIETKGLAAGGLSQSVTVTRQISVYLLQIETNRRHPNRKSKSVTPGPLLAAKMLQIETNQEPPQRCPSPLWWSREESTPIKRGDIKPSLRLAIPRPNENTATKSRTNDSPFAQILMEIQDMGAGLNGLAIVRHNVLVIVPVVFIVLIVKIASLVRTVLRKTRELNY